MNKYKKEIIELGKKICDEIGERDIESASSEGINIDGKVYALEEVKEIEWEDEGKYQNGECVYRIGVAYDDIPYNIEIPFDLYIKQYVSRNGSYYTDYNYEYEKPFVVEKKEVTTIKWVKIK